MMPKRLDSTALKKQNEHEGNTLRENCSIAITKAGKIIKTKIHSSQVSYN